MQPAVPEDFPDDRLFGAVLSAVGRAVDFLREFGNAQQRCFPADVLLIGAGGDINAHPGFFEQAEVLPAPRNEPVFPAAAR